MSQIFVGPTKTEWELGFPRFKHFLKGSFKDAAPIKPIMIVAKAVDSVLTGKSSLRCFFLREGVNHKKQNPIADGVDSGAQNVVTSSQYWSIQQILSLTINHFQELNDIEEEKGD